MLITHTHTRLNCLDYQHQHQQIFENVIPLHVRQLHERLFADFREVHSMLLCSLLRYIVDRAGGAKIFDYSSYYVHILSEFNEQSEFNPATAYRLDTCVLADLGPFKSQDSYKAFRVRLDGDDTAYRATKPTYQGTLVMVVRIKLGAATMDFMQPFPIFGAGSGFAESDFEEALQIINDGLVIRDVKGKKLFGHMTKEGDKWRWRRLPGAAAALSSRGMSFGIVS